MQIQPMARRAARRARCPRLGEIVRSQAARGGGLLTAREHRLRLRRLPRSRRSHVADKHEDKRPPQDTEAETSSGSCIDDEFAGRHGTVASKSSLKDEKQVALDTQ